MVTTPFSHFFAGCVVVLDHLPHQPFYYYYPLRLYPRGNNEDQARTWTTADFYGVGSQAPQDNVIWGSGRQRLPHTFAPREQVTFPFSIPPPPGGAPFQWRMVQDGKEWFGARKPAMQIYPEASAECRIIRARILDRETEIAGLQADLQPAPPGQRGKISAQIRIIRGHIQDERQRFQAIGCT